jgi:hypothetical protein
LAETVPEEYALFGSAMATTAVMEKITGTRDEIVSGYTEDQWLAPILKILRAEKELQQHLDGGNFDNWDPRELTKFRQTTRKEVRDQLSRTECRRF